MKWLIDDYKNKKKTHPNIYNEVAKHGHFFQARSDYGDLSRMHKTRDSAVAWAKKRNKTKKFNVTDSWGEFVK